VGSKRFHERPSTTLGSNVQQPRTRLTDFHVDEHRPRDGSFREVGSAEGASVYSSPLCFLIRVNVVTVEAFKLWREYMPHDRSDHCVEEHGQ